ncbi:hypothetical protein PanWU01x14_341470 [Parasponia andersonii]|uniref:Uncharacterized protein n=1 Tax=Parasponia andersonii TaxID=3476 RepID=A0A2P5AE46_PARAD|nr:hypothetical protein PanWU01x14_341470 [Parasponia andersonii]
MPNNASIGKPTLHFNILLRNKINGECLTALQDTAISNESADWLVFIGVNLLFKAKRDIDLFLFGAGEAAATMILVPNYRAATKIKNVTVFDHFGRSGLVLVKKLQWAALLKANLVITATNSDMRMLDAEEIELNAVTVSLEEDGLPTAYFDRLVATKGLIICDDVHTIESSNVNSLGLYYSKDYLKLTIHGRCYGIKSYADAVADQALIRQLQKWTGHAHLSLLAVAA